MKNRLYEFKYKHFIENLNNLNESSENIDEISLDNIEGENE